MLRTRFILTLLATVTACPLVPLTIAQDRNSSPPGQSESITTERRLDSVPPRSPEEALKSFELQPGFAIELVAAEPLVEDPVAFAFDPLGRLLVIEMRDYSEQATERLGRLKRLTDRDHDGRMDEAEILADQLSWPTAVGLCQRGILVAAAPELYLFEANRKSTALPKPLLSGFQRNNVQGLVNSFRWGIDSRLHGSTSSNGASLTGEGLTQPLELRYQDFSIDTRSLHVATVAGGGQHGMDFDRWGNKFVCSNSDHLQQILAWENPELQAYRSSRPVSWRRSIAADGPQAEVFRRSPVEAWRLWRTELRVSGAVAGLIEGGGRAAGYFTGATGVVIYDGDQWPNDDSSQAANQSESQSIALVADVGSNLLHRKRLVRDGLWYRGERIDQQTEFLRSDDIWFRPVQSGDGPDGALYIADMYREVIEHPLSLPPMIKKQLDLTSGRDRGRIWRVRSTDRPIRREAIDLVSLDTESLAEQIDHPNGWHRETIARLLYERQDPSSIPVLRELALVSHNPAVRLQALATLGALEVSIAGALDFATLDSATRDDHPRVRQRAIAEATRLLKSLGANDSKKAEAFRTRLYQSIKISAHDPSLDVRFELAQTAKLWFPDRSDRASALLTLIGDDFASEPLQAAVEFSAGDAAMPLLRQLLAKPLIAGDSAVHLVFWYEGLIGQSLQANGSSELLEMAKSAYRLNNDESKATLVAIGRAVSRFHGSLGESEQKAWSEWINNFVVPEARKAIHESTTSQPVDPHSLPWELLSLADATSRLSLLEASLTDGQPAGLQQIAIRQLVDNDAAAIDSLIKRINQFLPEPREEALRSLTSRTTGCVALLDAIASGQIKSGQLPSSTWLVLERHPQAEIAKRATELRGPTSATNWEKVAGRYREALTQKAKPEAGREVYLKHCAACHKVGREGTNIGPLLGSIRDKSADQIALSIAEPNREVDPRYQTYQAETVDGAVWVGIVESSNSSSIAIRDTRGELHIVDRSELTQFQSTGKSLMPEGLLDLISPEQLRDLIAFLRRE